MSYHSRIIALILLLLSTFLLAACGAVPAESPPTRLRPTVEEIPLIETFPAPTGTAVSTDTPIPPTMTTQPTITAEPSATSVPLTATTTATPAANLVIDHNSVALFEQIPEQYLQGAAALQMFFVDRSVGGNINNGLSCLSFDTDEDAPDYCSRWEHPGTPSYPVDPSEVDWSRPGGYDNSNWDYFFWPNVATPSITCSVDASQWWGKTECFTQFAAQQANNYDVMSFQFSYLSVSPGTTIADQPGGFFWDNATRFDAYDLDAWEAGYPNKTFIYWTTSLARGIGSQESENFNNQMRQWTSDNDKILFDVADILSHTPDGTPCYDNRDGVAYSINSNSENYPDDGLNRPAICAHYTSEVDGGHLGSPSAGMIRVSKAYWVLMARIAGWDGVP